MTPDVTAVLKRCDFTQATVALPPNEVLARPLYEAVTKELTARGGVWRGGKTKFLKMSPEAVAKLRADIGL